MDLASFSKAGSVGSERDGSEHSFGAGSGGEERGGGAHVFEYFGWVYHLGVNSIGHEYCHLRFLFIRGKYVEMYKRDPHENPGIKPIRKGVVGPTLMVEELGRRKVNHGDLYVLRFYNRLDEEKKGEIACATAGEARKWMEAFDHAKQEAEYELSRGGSSRNKLNMENEINLEGHRPRVRRYAHELRKLIRIGQGPETLLRQSSSLAATVRSDGYFDKDVGDVIEAHEWKCVRTINGVRIFEDVANSQSEKGVLVKAAAVVDASADTAFEVILKLERHQRYEWDILTGGIPKEILYSLGSGFVDKMEHIVREFDYDE
ncbi:START-like domain containing protein [Trema orientale]|uniref:START-like domain containing protein n=1 Tax=Trema orientale TaxID=63057 RepID=A0A2P5B699_TREOI|nr:START-like domain containing protein [Trema orientale]